MKLEIYKGFGIDFLKNIKKRPLTKKGLESKLNVLYFDSKTKKDLEKGLLFLENNEEAWVTYEEYSLIKNRVDDAIKDYELEVTLYKNNIYPDYYPIRFDMNYKLVSEIEKTLNDDSIKINSTECNKFLNIFNTVINIEGVLYGSYYNYEYDNNDINIKLYYSHNLDIEDKKYSTDIDIFINDDIETYLRGFSKIKSLKPSTIGVKTTNGLISSRILNSLKAYCRYSEIRLVNFNEEVIENDSIKKELISIAKNDINIKNFTAFRDIEFYKNPDINKETIKISQSTLIQEIIYQAEKDAVLKRIKSGEIDLLYLSPETLLSYSIETIIGDREIGLLIVDEAHIVTTWGVGFRPDYWYLGGYINQLRNKIQTQAGKKRKIYNFPICAFTATAINGGIDDSVSETIISLYMRNPVKYIGYIKRNDIKFDIRIYNSNKLQQSIYEEKKTKIMSERIKNWINGSEKTIVYFPYAKDAFNAQRGIRSFDGIKTDKRIGVFTGKNVDDLSLEAFNETKRRTFEMFKSGEQHIMYATKAFGMGVDIDDVQNVYHYAVSGNLCDYVQEIGRAARKNDMVGVAATDFFYNDMAYMNSLFGMSHIRQYQIKKVLEGIYNSYKSKNEAQSFLISPQSFTYIFNGKGMKDEDVCINKLKTCLLMLEKDFYDKYNFKVLISRPQSIFTKAYVVIEKEHENEVLSSEYGSCFRFVTRGRYHEKQNDGSSISDIGDVYTLDLKIVWEKFYKNMSFPQFKYWYFNSTSNSEKKVDVMPAIRKYFTPRQKVNIETCGDYLLNELREKILSDFEYIADNLYHNFNRKYFTTKEFIDILTIKYGSVQAKIIANSLFDLVDPNMNCVKRRMNANGVKKYTLSNGNLKEYMRKIITKSSIVNKLINHSYNRYSCFVNITNDEKSNISLKLLSIFGYISYEILGGEEPEIFIRLNDPQKIKNIILGSVRYKNKYVSRAKDKHDRDVNVLLKFLNELSTDIERWDYIEDYFLGYDVLGDKFDVVGNLSKV